MSTVEKIEQAIAQLSPAEKASLRDWFLQQDEQGWDAQITRDAQAGRLDALAEQALARYAKGQTTEL